MKYSAFAHFVGIGATLYGDDIDILKGGGDAAIIESYIHSKTTSGPGSGQEGLNESWVKIREIFEKFHFIPFDEKVWCKLTVCSTPNNRTLLI